MSEKILVVEDETTLAETLEYNPIREAYPLFTATDGPVGLKAVQ
jgi:DNA-binding response OmpR family regulator